jgi:NAD(P)H-nitrite reductase large subunit
MKYVIIGNSAAAVGCIEAIRKYDGEGSVTVISDEAHHVYSRPLISYYLAGKVSPKNMIYRHPDFYEKNRVETVFGKKAIAIDPKKKTVTLSNGTAVPYDKLLVATGSSPFVPPTEGLAAQDNVFTFLKYDDALGIEKLLNRESCVVIVGAGLIGLKAAEGIAPVAGSVHVVELAERVLPMILDDAAAAPVQKRIEAQGVTFHLGTVVEKVIGNKHIERVILKDGTELPCDILVMGVGVRPNVAEAKAAGVEVGRGIVIDAHSRTNVADIWAAGDVTESRDLISGECRIMALWPNAYAQGRAAGLDMCGRQEEDFEGVFPMNAVGFFGLPIITAGLQDGEGTSVLMKDDLKKGTMKRFIVKDDLLVGMILVGDVDRAGIYTSLMSEKIPLSSLDKKLTDDGFGLIALGYDRMKQRISS